MPHQGPADTRRAQYSSRPTEHAQADRAAVQEWWSQIARLADGHQDLTADVAWSIAGAVEHWGFSECLLALEMISAGMAGGLLHSPIAGRMQTSIRMRLDVLHKGMMQPRVPDAILIPYIGAEYSADPAALADDLRQPVELPSDLRTTPATELGASGRLGADRSE